MADSVFEQVDQFVLHSSAPTVPKEDELSAQEQLTFVTTLIDFWKQVPKTCRAQLQRVSESISQLDFPLIGGDFYAAIFSAEKIAGAEKKYGLSQEEVFAALLYALQLFLMRSDPRTAVIDDLWKLVVIALEKAANRNKPTNEPELYNERMASRVFKHRKQTIASLGAVNAEYVYFETPVANDKQGPELRGLAFISRTDLPKAKQPVFVNKLFVLLETGEHIIVETNASNLSRHADPEAYEKIPASLLLQAVIAAPLMVRMGVITRSQADTIAETFGEFIAPVTAEIIADTASMLPIEQVFVRAHANTAYAGHVTGPNGAEVRFPALSIDDTNQLAFVLRARITPSSYYLVSSLVAGGDDSPDVPIMKNDYPRQLSPYGVYLFPTSQDLFVLSAFPHNFILGPEG